MQVSLHSYSTSTGYHPTIKIVGFLARKFYKLPHLSRDGASHCILDNQDDANRLG